MENTQFASAVHIVIGVAHSTCKKTSDELAAGIKAHPVAIRRIVSRLSAAKILTSSRGKTGGVLLAKSVTELTLSDIYQAVDTKKAVQCRDAEKKCPFSCMIQGELDKLSTDLENLSLDYLKKITLADFMKKIEPEQKSSNGSVAK